VIPLFLYEAPQKTGVMRSFKVASRQADLRSSRGTSLSSRKSSNISSLNSIPGRIYKN
jgi:hypothetical protein